MSNEENVMQPTANVSLELKHQGLKAYLSKPVGEEGSFANIYKTTYLASLIYKMLTINPNQLFSNVEFNVTHFNFHLFNSSSQNDETITISTNGSIEECYSTYPEEATPFQENLLSSFLISEKCSINCYWLMKELCRDYSINLTSSYLMRYEKHSIQWLIPIDKDNTLDICFSFSEDQE